MQPFSLFLNSSLTIFNGSHSADWYQDRKSKKPFRIEFSFWYWRIDTSKLSKWGGWRGFGMATLCWNFSIYMLEIQHMYAAFPAYQCWYFSIVKMQYHKLKNCQPLSVWAKLWIFIKSSKFCGLFTTYLNCSQLQRCYNKKGRGLITFRTTHSLLLKQES